MKKIRHPYGNKKSFFLKFFKKIIQNMIRFFVNIFCKLDDNDEIIISPATHAPWRKDKEFLVFFNLIKNFTLLDPPRAYTLWQCSKNVGDQNGIILDIGCLLGGSGFIMSKKNRKGKTYLFDSFSGFKKDDGIHKKEVFFFNDINFVKRNIRKLKLFNTYVFKAYFPKNITINIKKIKLCHIDVNTFNDTKKVFNFIQKRLISGGIIIFDDFGIWGVNGIKKFVYSVEKKYNKKYYFIKNYMGQCILIKK
tara:strand:- start:1642 stop:2391 length:750 start_codon:yes stop_codon:yes gene_type:complete